MRPDQMLAMDGPKNSRSVNLKEVGVNKGLKVRNDVLLSFLEIIEWAMISFSCLVKFWSEWCWIIYGFCFS